MLGLFVLSCLMFYGAYLPTTKPYIAFAMVVIGSVAMFVLGARALVYYLLGVPL